MRASIRFLLNVCLPALLMCLIAGEVYSALAGPSSFARLAVLEQEIAERDAELAVISARRDRLALHAEQLNPQSLDPDLVDERIRSVLGFVAEEDMVIPADQIEQLIAESRKAD
jgi:cell division protein FtsB